jgi:hypothetical protein
MWGFPVACLPPGSSLFEHMGSSRSVKGVTIEAFRTAGLHNYTSA